MRETYVTFHLNDVRGVCIPELEPHLEFFTRQFDRWLTDQPMKIFLERPNLVAGLKLPSSVSPSTPWIGPSVVVKRFGWRSLLHRILSPMTESKAIRCFRIAAALHRAGVATPRPLIAWEHRRYGWVISSYYITEEIPEAISFRKLLQWSDRNGFDLKIMLVRLARHLRGMHDAGILHRDLTLGNFLVDFDPARSESEIYLIDLSRAVQLGRIPLPLRMMDLARIKLEEHWPIFFEAYCEGRPEWRSWKNMLDLFVRLRRRKMDLLKKLK